MQVKNQVADASTEVVQITPDKRKQNEFYDWVGHPALNRRETVGRRDAKREQRHQNKRKTEKQQCAADTVQN